MKNLTVKDLSVDYEVEMPTGMGSGCYYMDPASAEEVFGVKLISFEYEIK